MTDKTPAETETQLADDYLTGAVLGRQLSHAAMEQALKEAKAGTLRDPAKTAMNAAITSGTLLDKRLLLQNRPQQIIAHLDPRAEGQALARQLGITIDSTATELPAPNPDPNPLPLKYAKRSEPQNAEAPQPRSFAGDSEETRERE